MKSAYELAMERLEREHGPTKKLNDEQKAEIAAIDKKYEAQAAEARLNHDRKLAAVASAAEFEQLQEEFAAELARIDAGREREKEAVWNAE